MKRTNGVCVTQDMDGKASAWHQIETPASNTTLGRGKVFKLYT